MKKLFVFMYVALVASLTTSVNAQEALVDIEFNKGGAVNKGTYSNNLTAFNTTYASTYYDPIKGKYLGITHRDSRGFYYMLYNADDALGNAFSTAATWELLFRLDNQQAMSFTDGADSGLGTSKIFSSQESGGWSLYNYGSYGLRFQYVTASATNTYMPDFLVETGKYYHVVVSIDKATRKANMYINGKHLVKDAEVNASDFKFPNCGSPRRLENMWWSLGADPGATNAPDRCSNSNQAAFVNARIYKGALTSEQVANLYNDNVKYYTEPKITNYNQMILDGKFSITGITDVSKVSAKVNRLTPVGNVPMRYNKEQKRFEGVFTKNSGNYFRYDFGYDPMLSAEFSDSYSFEVYAKANSSTNSAILSPLSGQQSGGMGFEFSTNGSIRFNSNTYGYHSKHSACKASCAIVSTPANTLTTDYTHYVVVFDRIAGTSRIYIDGKLKAAVDTVLTYDNVSFCYGSDQWIAIGGDTRSSNIICDYPFDGQISIARIWDKGLTESDVKELYSQSQGKKQTITIGSSGYATACFPFVSKIPTGVSAYVATAENVDEIVLTKLASAGSFVAYGTPMVLVGAPGTYEFEPVDFVGEKILSPTTNILQGTYIDQAFDAETVYMLAADGSFSSNAGSVSAMSAYFPATKGITSKTIKLASGTAPYSQDIPIEANIVGDVTCSGVGVEGVVVSDGYEVTTTDANGHYELLSNKKNGYVFISLPSNYIMRTGSSSTASEKIFTPFWQQLEYSTLPNKVETHDFKLKVVNNDNHIYIAGADSHLSTTSSTDQFLQMYIPKMKEEVSAAGTTPIYSTILGDLTCNYHWYTYNYFPSTFRSTLTNYNYPLVLFPIMGNHDHDSAVDDGLNSSYNSTKPYRTALGPHYYSYNLGKIHYVVIDDTYFLNTHTPGASYSTGVTGDQDYHNYIERYQLDWLKKDLEYVDKETPVIVQCHIPVHGCNSTTFAATDGLKNGPENSTQLLDEILKDFKTVHIITGHTHYNYHVYPSAYPNIHENNILGICAVWWATYPVTKRHNCRDGCPGGYEVFYMNGKDIKWQFHSMEDDGNAQFHAMDMNPVKKVYQTDDIIKQVSELYKTRDNIVREDFSTIADNTLLLNVYNYNEKWKIKVVENNKNLVPVREYHEDPVHYMMYEYPMVKQGKKPSKDARATKSFHIFRVQCATPDADVEITVTDEFGNVYTETVHRPMTWDANFRPHNKHVTAIKDIKYNADKASIYVKESTICIESEHAGVARIVSLDGTMVEKNIRPGHNEFAISQRGVYIVSANDQTQKVFVK